MIQQQEVASLNKAQPVQGQAIKLENIPTIDMNSSNVGRELTDAFQAIGFCTLINHGISHELIDEAFKWSSAFFQSPQKKNIPSDHSNFKGYWMKNERRELLELGFFQYETEKKYYPKIQGFGQFFQSYLEKLNQLHQQILSEFQSTLKLPSGSLINMSKDTKYHKFRILNYPEVNLQETKKDGLVRAQPHTDFGLITLLIQKPGYGQNGLRVMSNDRSWIRVFPEDYSIVVNIGDTMQLLTNDLLKSTIHSVWVDNDVLQQLEEGKIEKSPERKSMAMFFNPSDDVILKSLPEFGKSEYEPISAKDFIVGRNISAKKNTTLTEVPES